MAASRAVLKRLSGRLLSGSLLPATLSAASRSGSLHPGTLPAASHSYCTSTNAVKTYFDRFYVECHPKPHPPFVHHETKVDKRTDGLHIWMFMAGVGKENVKVWIEGGELIAQGIKDKDWEDKGVTGIVTTRYKMLIPPDEIFNLDGITAEINNGMLKVFVPRRIPEEHKGYRMLRLILESNTTVWC